MFMSDLCKVSLIGLDQPLENIAANKIDRMLEKDNIEPTTTEGEELNSLCIKKERFDRNLCRLLKAVCRNQQRLLSASAD